MLSSAWDRAVSNAFMARSSCSLIRLGSLGLCVSAVSDLPSFRAAIANSKRLELRSEAGVEDVCIRLRERRSV